MTSMKGTALAAAVAFAATMFGSISPAQAHNCISACNLVAKSCTKDAKKDRDAARGECGDVRDICREDCSLDRVDCGDGETCRADLEACRDSCSADREACNAAAGDQRHEEHNTCKVDRRGCKGTCRTPEDRNCVDACGRAAGRCFKDIRTAAKQCKYECEEAEKRGMCRKGCKANRRLGRDACIAGFDSCLNVCVPPTTSTTIVSPTTTTPPTTTTILFDAP